MQVYTLMQTFTYKENAVGESERVVREVLKRKTRNLANLAD